MASSSSCKKALADSRVTSRAYPAACRRSGQRDCRARPLLPISPDGPLSGILFRRWSGTFYRAASPESARLCRCRERGYEDTVVCIIEAMKVMNEIKAEISGVIAEVVAENGKPVQFGQVLFRVR